MNHQEIEDLIKKYNKGLCTEQEKGILETWYANWNKDKLLHISIEAIQEDLLINRKKTLSQIHIPSKSHTAWFYISAAAAIIFIVGISLFYFNTQYSKPQQTAVTVNDIAPGSIGATLTLVSGKKIKLTDATNGVSIKESGVTITKTADGQIIYEVKDLLQSESGKTNTLSTSNGETYRILLPDKSEVWLNAASILKYPISFTKSKERLVELEGEAYFQIAKDKQHPFIVKTNRQEVKVLGTHFNVKAYTDEPIIKTTLIEGSVLVSDQFTHKMLKPGQQAILSEKGKFKIGPSDEVLDLAWKNNEFMFESESIENVMKMVERWYNVEVIYIGEKPDEKFGGGVSRFDKVSKVLELLERTGAVDFKIENRKIYVMKVTKP